MSKSKKEVIVALIPILLVIAVVITFKYDLIKMSGLPYKVCNLDNGGTLQQTYHVRDHFERVDIETKVMVEKCHSTSGNLGDTYCNDVAVDEIVYKLVSKDSVEFYKEKAINELKFKYNKHIFPEEN